MRVLYQSTASALASMTAAAALHCNKAALMGPWHCSSGHPPTAMQQRQMDQQNHTSAKQRQLHSSRLLPHKYSTLAL
jgi:hypothetical protein